MNDRRVLQTILLTFVLMLASCASVPSTSPSERLHDLELTQDTIHRLDRYWPYLVGLTGEVEVATSAKPLRNATRGVLIRVESGGLARIDFGRHGVHQVPVSSTDILASAQEIKAGELKKLAPNFELAVGRSIANPASEGLMPIRYRDLDESRWVVIVRGDPQTATFEAQALPVYEAAREYGVPVILFPDGEGSDLDVATAIREGGLLSPFVYKRFMPSLRSAIFGEGDVPFEFVLQTHEGRIEARTSSPQELVEHLRILAASSTESSHAL